MDKNKRPRFDKGFTLIGTEFVAPQIDLVENMQAHAVQVTGSDMLPAVRYKGRVIEAGRIGERSL